MIKWIMRRFALSEQGAKGFVEATAATVLQNVLLILPVNLLFVLAGDALSGEPLRRAKVLALCADIIILAMVAVSYWQYNACFFSTYRESGVRRVNLAEKLRKLPLSFFGKRDLSDLTTVIMGDCTTIEHMFSHVMPQFAGAIVSTLIVAAGLLCYEPRMAAAALWPLPISLAIVLFSSRVQKYFSRKKNSADLAMADGIQEALETMRDLRANRAEQAYLDGLDAKIDEVERKALCAELGTAVFVVSAAMLLRVGVATTALTGGVLLAQGRISVVTFFAFLLVVSRIYEPMGGTLINLAAIISADVNIERMNKITETPEQTGSTDFEPNSYDIEFEHVGFAYEDGQTVLSDVSFTAKQGEVTALIGPSGGGKTTATKLAARFWDIDRGRITVGGVDIASVDPEKLLSVYSIVFQNVTLFAGTVMENIRIGRQSATDAEVLQAARDACCDEFASRLPQGYQTQIGENGSALSGGERQRISIARALLKNAPIVLLDEATASLDAENETQIQLALSRLLRDKTVLIIAHRMRTVEGADKLVLLSGGAVAEQGSPQALREQNGLYAHMAALQKRSSDWAM